MKHSRFILGGLAVLMLAGALAAWRWPTAARVGEPVIVPDTIHVGQAATVRLHLRLPWGRTPNLDALELPAGLQLTGEKWQWRGLGWGVCSWRLTLLLQPYDLGPFVTIPAQISGMAVEFPAPTVIPRDDLDALPEAAGQLPFSLLRDRALRPWLWAGGILTLIILIGLAVWLARRAARRPPPPPPPPWEQARLALQALEDQLPLPAELAIVRLTDIVRGYIEAAFALPATEQTTPEFLHTLSREDHGLLGEHRDVLRTFLQQGDLVKFAGADLSQDELRQALAMARRFVGETAKSLAVRSAGEGGA